MRAALLLILLLSTAPLQAADRTTQQTGPAGPFTAAVETLKLGAAEIVTTAFWRDPAPGAPARPVTFALNGGPGAASAWLNLGAIGPWRVPIQLPVSPSQDPTPIDNAETWLGFTDLVFIDPPGTGYSRTTPDTEDARRPFLTVDGDIQLLAATIHRWLEQHHRLASPITIAGESYGGFRAPRLARALLQQQGVGVRNLVLISPVLDFNGRDAAYDPVRWAARLPSLVALARHATSRAQLADAEAYAGTDYIADLLRGPNDPAALERLTTRLAALTGLDTATLRRRAGRPDLEFVLRTEGQVASPYDATIAAPDPFPAAPRDNSPDPVLDGLRAPVTAAMLTIYQRLDWQPEGGPRTYQLLNDGIARSWDYGRSNNRPESMTALRQFLALDPAAQVLVTHGLTDLVTPYFATALLLAQVPKPARLALHVYPGGHMSYLRADSRAAMKADAEALLTRPRPATP